MFCERVIEFELRMNHAEGRFKLAAKDGDGPIFDPEALPEVSDPDAIDTTGSRDFLLLRSHMDEVAFNETGSKVLLFLRPREKHGDSSSDTVTVSGESVPDQPPVA